MSVNWEGLIFFSGCHDMEQTHHFYAELLGLPLYKDQGLCRIYEVPGGGKIGFCTHMKIAKNEKSPIITLLTQDVDGAYQRLIQAGLAPLHTPQENPRFCIYHFFVHDPNGYLVEVQRFLE